MTFPFRHKKGAEPVIVPISAKRQLCEKSDFQNLQKSQSVTHIIPKHLSNSAVKVYYGYSVTIGDYTNGYICLQYNHFKKKVTTHHFGRLSPVKSPLFIIWGNPSNVPSENLCPTDRYYLT